MKTCTLEEQVNYLNGGENGAWMCRRQQRRVTEIMFPGSSFSRKIVSYRLCIKENGSSVTWGGSLASSLTSCAVRRQRTPNRSQPDSGCMDNSLSGVADWGKAQEEGGKG